MIPELPEKSGIGWEAQDTLAVIPDRFFMRGFIRPRLISAERTGSFWIQLQWGLCQNVGLMDSESRRIWAQHDKTF